MIRNLMQNFSMRRFKYCAVLSMRESRLLQPKAKYSTPCCAKVRKTPDKPSHTFPQQPVAETLVVQAAKVAAVLE